MNLMRHHHVLKLPALELKYEMKKESLNVVSFITTDRYMYTDHTAIEKIMFFCLF